MSWLSGALSGGATLLGSAISAITGKSARDTEYQRQQEFAQNGVRWRVEDAKAAGIHPLVALGAHTSTYSPQAAVGTDYGLSSAGQNISRAIEAKQTARERQEMNEMQKALIASQIRKTDAETKRIQDSTIDDALRFAALSSRAVTQRQPKAPAMPSTDKPVGTYADLASGIVPYVVGDTIMEFPPEDVADMMEDPKMMALWKGAIELAWNKDPKLREHVIRKLPKHMQDGIRSGSHELVRIPGYGLNYRRKQTKPSYSAPKSGGIRGFYGGQAELRR